MTGFLKGVATAIITPFDGNGINLQAFGEMMEAQITGGVDALVVLGTTGEPSTMTEEEKEALMRFAAEKNAGRVKLLFGTGANSTDTAVRQSKKAEQLGADGILAVTPYYNKCTQRGLYEYYQAVCEAVKIPVVCYNVPSRTGVNILPRTMEKIAEIKGVAGVKDACGNMAQTLETARLIRGKCDLYSGEDALNLPILCAGGTAVISVVSNLAPLQVKALVQAVNQGDLKAANEINDALLPLVNACFAEVNPIPAKEGMNLLGYAAGSPRAPLTQAEPETRSKLISAMKSLGLKVRA